MKASWAAAVVALLAGAVLFWLAYKPGSEGRPGWGAAVKAYSKRAGTVPAVGLGVVAAGCVVAAGLTASRRRARHEQARRELFTKGALRDDQVLDRMLAIMTDQMAFHEAEVSSFIELLVDGAVRLNAKGAVVLPLRAGTRVSLQTAAGLRPVGLFPIEHHKQLVSKLKVLAKLELFGPDKEQQGSYTARTHAGPHKVTVKIVPGNAGAEAHLTVEKA